MSIRNTYPTIRPSLNLDFARSRTLDPRITFSRTTTGTYMDSDGLIKVASADEARFDHRYVNGQLESLGLLVEEQRENLLLQSEDFSTTWLTQNVGSAIAPVVTTNQAAAPDGSNTADLVVFDLDGSTVNGDRSQLVQVFETAVVGLSYVFSAWIKTSDGTSKDIRFSFNGASPQVITATADWQRVSIVLSSAGSTTINPRISLRVGVSTSDYASVYLWGAQLEEGAFPTSYIPTSGSTATRNPDNVSMTGDNFSDWYNPSEGAISITCSTYTDGSDYINALTLSDGSLVDLNNTLEIALTSSSTNTNVGRLTVRTNGSTPVDVGASGVIANLQSNKKYKMMVSYEKDDFAFSVDGVTYFTSESGDLPLNISKLSIGHRRSNLDMLFGHISKLSYYPRRLSNSQLQNLTK